MSFSLAFMLCGVYSVDRDQCVGQCAPAIPSAASTPPANVTIRRESSSQSSSETAPSGSDYDDIVDVTEDNDEVAEENAQENTYDDLQESTRDVITQGSSVYEQIQTDAAASATNSDVNGRQDKPRIYMEVIADDETQPAQELTKTFRHKYVTISTENAAKASTL